MVHTTLSLPKTFQNLNEMDEFLGKSTITKLKGVVVILEGSTNGNIWLTKKNTSISKDSTCYVDEFYHTIKNFFLTLQILIYLLLEFILRLV